MLVTVVNIFDFQNMTSDFQIIFQDKLENDKKKQLDPTQEHICPTNSKKRSANP